MVSNKTTLYIQKNKKKISKKINIFKIFKKNYRNLKYSPRKVNIVFRIIIITIAAFLVTFALDIFIHPAKLYSGGLRGIQQIIIYAIPTINQNMWASYLIFFAINVPFAYFGFKYIGKKFTFLTLYFVLIQSLFSYLLYAGETMSENFHIFYYRTSNTTTFTDNGNNFRYLGAIIGGVIYGLGVALTFVAGASSGGSKFLVAYLAHKKNMSLGKIGIYLAILIVTSGILINVILIDGKSFFKAFLSTRLFATILYIGVQNFIINILAPRTTRTRITIEVKSSQIPKIKKVIQKTIMSKRSWYTFKTRVGDDKVQSAITSITIDKRETQYIIRKLYKACPEATISWHNVQVRTAEFITRGFD